VFAALRALWDFNDMQNKMKGTPMTRAHELRDTIRPIKHHGAVGRAVAAGLMKPGTIDTKTGKRTPATPLPMTPRQHQDYVTDATFESLMGIHRDAKRALRKLNCVDLTELSPAEVAYWGEIKEKCERLEEATDLHKINGANFLEVRAANEAVMAILAPPELSPQGNEYEET
jgi:hypothetical protein